jgi:uncharacterized membrane protein YgaE (UPF0421/DUF939 family)
MDQHYQLISFFKSIVSSEDAEIVNNIETALKKEEKERQELHFLRHSELQYIVYNMNMLKSQDTLHETLTNLEKLYYTSETRKSNMELKSEILNTHSIRKEEMREIIRFFETNFNIEYCNGIHTITSFSEDILLIISSLLCTLLSCAVYNSIVLFNIFGELL